MRRSDTERNGTEPTRIPDTAAALTGTTSDSDPADHGCCARLLHRLAVACSFTDQFFALHLVCVYYSVHFHHSSLDISL